MTTRAILLSTGLGVCQSALAQTATVEITDPRPVAEAVQMLERIYGIPINYEDPIAVHESQLKDVTEEVQRTPDPSHRIIVQKSPTLSFAYKQPASLISTGGGVRQTQVDTEAAIADALSSVLQGYAVSGGPVTFTVAAEGGVFHLAPTNFLNKDGKLQQMVPVLDTKITILPKQRTAESLLNEICAALTKATGIQVRAGTVPMNLFLRSTTAISGTDVDARTLLARLLAELSTPISQDGVFDGPDGEKLTRKREAYERAPLSWRLLYGPGWGYSLNIHPVTVANKCRVVSSAILQRLCEEQKRGQCLMEPERARGERALLTSARNWSRRLKG
jgi:hypothetical protein